MGNEKKEGGEDVTGTIWYRFELMLTWKKEQVSVSLVLDKLFLE